jgi:hypothetical protein
MTTALLASHKSTLCAVFCIRNQRGMASLGQPSRSQSLMSRQSAIGMPSCRERPLAALGIGSLGYLMWRIEGIQAQEQ